MNSANALQLYNLHTNGKKLKLAVRLLRVRDMQLVVVWHMRSPDIQKKKS